MLSIEYKASKQLIEGYQAIEHKHNSEDIKLVGLNGYMWLSRNGTYSARITNHKTINRYYAEPDYKYTKGQDKLVHTKEVMSLIKRLKVPVDVEKQLQLIYSADNDLSAPVFGPCRYL